MTTVRLADGDATADIALLGAELRAWRVGEVDLIWTSDPAIWADTAPILFPVVGWTRNAEIRVDGCAYPLGLHGFARHKTFRVIEQTRHSVRLRLDADDATRALYPFDWSLEVEFRLEGNALGTRLIVYNAAARTMPYACGLHPGFRWPFAGGALDDYAIIFAEAEAASVPIISHDGLFTRERRDVPVAGRSLSLTPALMAHEALCFLDARSRSLSFAHRGGAALDIALEDFPHIALWSRLPGRFLSIEAWTGHGDFVDSDGELFAKPSMQHLAPGAVGTHAACFTYRSASRRSRSGDIGSLDHS